MKNDIPVRSPAEIRSKLYPHFKVTNESFPRVLATRLVEDDGAEYFGAFLTKTAMRITMDLIVEAFQVRTCDIPIDGSFIVPCTEHFRSRCIAPCVASLCDKETYDRQIYLVKLFLANDRSLLRETLLGRIAELAELHEFESAAFYRDILNAVEAFWANARWDIWLDGKSVDTWVPVDDDGTGLVVLITKMGRFVVGRKVFEVGDIDNSETGWIELFNSYYLFHLPKEVRITRGLNDASTIARQFHSRFGRSVSIMQNAALGPHVSRAVAEALGEDRLRKRVDTVAEMIQSAVDHFALDAPPDRIVGIDVAHISGTGFVAAAAVWPELNKNFDEPYFAITKAQSEPAALAEFAAVFAGDRPGLTLFLVDGGKGQLNAVKTALPSESVISAVKPPGKHGSVAAFLTTAGISLLYDETEPLHALLKLLHDGAHDLANRIHREYREMLPFEGRLVNGKPLIVPLRYTVPDGNASDLRPISFRMPRKSF